VRDAQFTTVRLIAGYDIREVDDILDHLVATLASYEHGIAGPRISSAELESLEITQTKLREGYKVREVDELLEQVAKDLRNYEGLPARGSVSGPAVHSAAAAGGLPAWGEGRREEHGSYPHADRAIAPATGGDTDLATNVDAPGAGRHTSATVMSGDTSLRTTSPNGPAGPPGTGSTGTPGTGSTPSAHSAPDGSAFSPAPDPRRSGQSNSAGNGLFFGAATPEQSGPEAAGLGATGSAAAGAFFSNPAHAQTPPDAGAVSPPDAGATSQASTKGFFRTSTAPQAPTARVSSNVGAAAAQATNNAPQGLDPAAFIRQLMEEHKLQAPGGDPMPVLIRTPDNRTYAVKAVELTPNGLVVTVGE
jgi:DivIVA domain-containing protein